MRAILTLLNTLPAFSLYKQLLKDDNDIMIKMDYKITFNKNDAIPFYKKKYVDKVNEFSINQNKGLLKISI